MATELFCTVRRLTDVAYAILPSLFSITEWGIEENIGWERVCFTEADKYSQGKKDSYYIFELKIV